jgi:hypothetical protein
MAAVPVLIASKKRSRSPLLPERKKFGTLESPVLITIQKSWSPTRRSVESWPDRHTGCLVPVVPVAFPGAVTDRTPGMLSLQVGQCVAAASMPSDDMAAVKGCAVDPAPTVDGDPVGRVVGNGSAASGARSALRSDDRTVTHVLGRTVPTHPIRPVDEAHAAGLSGIPGSLKRSCIASLCTRFLGRRIRVGCIPIDPSPLHFFFHSLLME